MSISEQCDMCGSPYEITTKNAKLYCFLGCLKANHVEAKCPNGHEENIFLTIEAFMHVISEIKLGVVFGLEPSQAFMEQCLEAWGEDDEVVHTSESGKDIDAPTKEIEVPHYLLRELYDQLREFENTN